MGEILREIKKAAFSEWVVSSEALEAWSTACLLGSRVPKLDAEKVSRMLVQTSLWGIDSHGIARLPHYLSRIAAGSLNPSPDFATERTGPCTANLDASHALGIVAMHEAVRVGLEMARESGLGFVGVRESSHCGAVGYYGRMIAEAGMIGLVVTHSDAFVAPENGFRKFLGTNPLCISAPRSSGEPVCLDMATSAVAWNLVMNAQREGLRLGEGMAYDADGHPTQDPHAVACLRPVGGHKGYALAFMIEILCGPLNGMPWGPHVPPMYGDLAARRHLGSFVGVIDPKRFFGGPYFESAVDALVQAARMQPALDDAKPVMAPGDDHYAHAQFRLRHGIPVEPGFREQMEAWSARLGVTMPPIVRAS